MQFSGLLPLLRLCDGSFRRAELDETEFLLRTPQRQSYPRASRGCEVPARPSRNLALHCLDRRRSGSCAGVSLQVTACRPNLPPTRRHRVVFGNSSGSLAMFAAIRRRPYSEVAGLSFPVAARLQLAAAGEFVSR